MGVAQATVCGDLRRVREAWRESSVRDFDELRSIELLKIERVEREAWAGWQRSERPQQTATIKGECGPGQKASKTMKSRAGDPQFLTRWPVAVNRHRPLAFVPASEAAAGSNESRPRRWGRVAAS